MNVKYFLDTNLFIYQLDTEDKRKSVIADQIIRDAVTSSNACISFQVVQECLNTMLKKAQICLTAEQAERYLEASLKPLLRIYPSISLYRSGLRVQSRYQYSFYDSLIIASALQAGCKKLYSEDLQHGQRIEQLTITNPFLA
jgi:predicted nucleic acid-binding protein